MASEQQLIEKTFYRVGGFVPVARRYHVNQFAPSFSSILTDPTGGLIGGHNPSMHMVTVVRLVKPSKSSLHAAVNAVCDGTGTVKLFRNPQDASLYARFLANWQSLNYMMPVVVQVGYSKSSVLCFESEKIAVSDDSASADNTVVATIESCCVTSDDVNLSRASFAVLPGQEDYSPDVASCCVVS